MANLSRFVRHHALRTPERVALVYEAERVSYGQLWRRIRVVAGLLRAHGIGKGERVAVLMKNSAAFLDIALAVSHVGAVLVPVNFRLAADEVDHILQDSGALLLFRDEELANWTPAIPAVIQLDTQAQQDASRLGSGGDDVMAPVGPDDLLRIMYTSGTTDRPKGVMHSYGNFYAKSSDQLAELGLTSNTRLLVCGPLYHVGAFDLPGVAVLWVGGMLCVQRDFDAARALELIEREALTGAWLAPVMAGALLGRQAADPRNVRSLQWIIGGGERTPESRIRHFAVSFPNAHYIDAYGLTETCGGDTLMERGRELEKIGSVGRALPQVDIDICDREGRSLPCGEQGEICIRGAKVTQGYWRSPEKSAASFFGDWLRTGDMGYLDTQGFLFITDRKKDMIISGGENVASCEIERAILELPQVQDAAVIGMPDARWGERPVSFIVLHPGCDLPEAEILSHCRRRLAPFKVPDRVIFATGLPRSASGKVLKRQLRESVITQTGAGNASGYRR
jgi:acyl-CoA synthetase (AMP-forming)/AMP-acid ligase II